ncbi:cytochrome C oxidase subunit IV family protein [uncultured Arcticibacterium sp.]|uniref:cytochrome C oxidase subunit IV family protein n=1 Tax=uncultured Arcticibacterium sp. TaxID=2173042 RepID=UPI0030FC3BEE
MAEHIENIDAEKQKPQTKELWKVFWILLIITAVEFVIAFQISSDSDFGKWLKISLFIILTFVKSFYIVGTFMHLKHEVKALIWTVVLPVVFVLWFILALVYYEGGYIGSLK